FEQAGGLMNLYTDTKIDRYTGWGFLEEIPAAVFQSLNAGYIIIFGTIIGGFWIWWKKKGYEASSLFKMALGTIIMGLGYVFMMFASKEASAEVFGKAAMTWIFLAYLFHTIGELCTSPVALSFITKLAPLKYASIMMGVYFAATGFGNKLAGSIGESAQLEPFKGELVADKQQVIPFMSQDSIQFKNQNKELEWVYDYPINQDKNFRIHTQVFLENGEVVFRDMESGEVANDLFQLSGDRAAELTSKLEENQVNEAAPYHAALTFEKDQDAAKVEENRGDGQAYGVTFVLEEEQSEQEYQTFMWLTIFTVCFGFLLILFLKKLKKLTHGAEDHEREFDEKDNEPYELSDEDINTDNKN